MAKADELTKEELLKRREKAKAGFKVPEKTVKEKIGKNDRKELMLKEIIEDPNIETKIKDLKIELENIEKREAGINSKLNKAIDVTDRKDKARIANYREELRSELDKIPTEKKNLEKKIKLYETVQKHKSEILNLREYRITLQKRLEVLEDKRNRYEDFENEKNEIKLNVDIINNQLERLNEKLKNVDPQNKEERARIIAKIEALNEEVGDEQARLREKDSIKVEISNNDEKDALYNGIKDLYTKISWVDTAWRSLLKGKNWDEIEATINGVNYTANEGTIYKIKDLSEASKEERVSTVVPQQSTNTQEQVEVSPEVQAEEAEEFPEPQEEAEEIEDEAEIEQEEVEEVEEGPHAMSFEEIQELVRKDEADEAIQADEAKEAGKKGLKKYDKKSSISAKIGMWLKEKFDIIKNKIKIGRNVDKISSNDSEDISRRELYDRYQDKSTVREHVDKVTTPEKEAPKKEEKVEDINQKDVEGNKTQVEEAEVETPEAQEVEEPKEIKEKANVERKQEDSDMSLIDENMKNGKVIEVLKNIAEKGEVETEKGFREQLRINEETKRKIEEAERKAKEEAEAQRVAEEAKKAEEAEKARKDAIRAKYRENRINAAKNEIKFGKNYEGQVEMAEQYEEKWVREEKEKENDKGQEK